MTDPFYRVQAGRGEQKNKLNKEKKKIGQIELIESSHSDVFLGGGANPTSPCSRSAGRERREDSGLGGTQQNKETTSF